MSRYDLTPAELAEVLSGEASFRTAQVWEGLYRSLDDPAELTTLPKALRARLAHHAALEPAFDLVQEQASDRGATLKWLLSARRDGQQIETVLMRYSDRVTVCVSSQAGCAMGCSFCATGQMGYFRQLSIGEIVEQVVLAARTCRQRGAGRLSNVVMMGMGEPMANYANVMAAVRRCNEELGLAARAFTISTVGIVPGIRRLAGEALQVNLAVSLHAADDELRSSLVPVNRRYPLGDVMAACRHYVATTNRRVSFEWALIAGVNDRPSDAAGLARLLDPLGRLAHVNLIPLNPTPGYLAQGSRREVVEAFRDRLAEAGVNVTIRATRGRGMNGACGQLAGAGTAAGAGPRAGADSEVVLAN